MRIAIKPTVKNPKGFFNCLIYFYDPNGQGGLCDNAQELSELRSILKNMSTALYCNVISTFEVTDENRDAFHHFFLDVVSVGNASIVEEFLTNRELNLNYNHTRGIHKTALQCASYHNHEGLVKRFITLGADCTVVESGLTSFMWAIRLGYPKVVAAFLEERTFHELTNINNESYNALSELYNSLAMLNADNTIKESVKAQIDAMLDIAIRNPRKKLGELSDSQIQIETVQQAINIAVEIECRPVFHGITSLSMGKERLARINSHIELISDTTYITMNKSVIALSRLERARVLWSIGKYDEAMNDYTHILESQAFADDSQLQLEICCVQRLQNKTDEAELPHRSAPTQQEDLVLNSAKSLTVSGLFKDSSELRGILSEICRSGFRVDTSQPRMAP